MAIVTREQERDFERAHVAKLTERYLATDVMERVRWDRGYAEKIEIIERFVSRERLPGPILDLGSNTAGEAEVLAQRGYPVVATDINELALALSKRRAQAFGRIGPEYYAADAHRLPFADGTFGAVVAFEVLHHFEKLEVVLRELHRVLAPGGRLLAYEPYALNPYRRLAELRFIVLGSIERSFTVGGLARELQGVGFAVEDRSRHVLPPSEWKKQNASALRARLKDLYFAVGRRMLPVFGNIVMTARKPGTGTVSPVADVSARLRCPISGAELRRVGAEYVTRGGAVTHRYPIVDGIPVLVASDTVRDGEGSP